MAVSMSDRRAIRRRAMCWRRLSSSSVGTHSVTAIGRPAELTATNTMRLSVALVKVPVARSPDRTTTRMCMLLRPVCTSWAVTSTSSPNLTGRENRTLPT